MSDQTEGSVPAPLSLPDAPNLEWLRKQAKRRLAELRATNSSAQLADAQFDLAKQYGFSSWRALKAHVDALTLDGRLFEAARAGDVAALAALLDAHPEKLYVRMPPYEHTLLHMAAQNGQLAIVDLLLQRGMDPDTREKGDDTYAMHWAAAAGNLEIVRRLADAGGDVIGHGDDHQLEVIGWATCWDGIDQRHHAIADFLVSRGARHHIFSAIALNRAAEVRRIVARDPAALNQRMSRNEDQRTPLHFAVVKRLPEMVSLLLELGADPLAVNGSGHPTAIYATMPDIDRPVMERISAMTAAELDSARRGRRAARTTMVDLLASIALADWETAARLVRDNPQLLDSGGGALHLMAKRNDLAGVTWLLEHGADPDGRWLHFDAFVTPLHMAVMEGHIDIVRRLLEANADPTIRDSLHDSDALGWAEFFVVHAESLRRERQEIVKLIEARAARP